MGILGIIPARGGSKGVARKNIREVAGRPLIAYTIEAAAGSQELTHFVCSTEDTEIARIANDLGCPVLERPAELAGDATPMKAVIRQVLAAVRPTPEIVVLLQPTSPLRTSAHIDCAIQMLVHADADSVVSVSRVAGHFHPEWQLKLDHDNQL